MRKFIIIVIIILIVFSSLIYVDYFNAKENNTYPRLALKSENNDAIIYTAIMYKVWYCKTNKMYMVGSYGEDDICPKNYEYVNNVYKNTNGVSFSKRDLQLLTNDGVYTSEMIENMTDDKQVKDAIYVAENYLKTIYKVVNENDNGRIIIFPEFQKVGENYSWVYEEQEDNYYCLSNDDKSFAKLENDQCGKYVNFKMDNKWCSLYKNSTLVYDDKIGDLCKE